MGGGGGEMNWESSIDGYTPSCIKQVASGRQLDSIGSSARCSVMTYRSGVGRRREAQEEEEI